jgi:hypothetical protein
MNTKKILLAAMLCTAFGSAFSYDIVGDIDEDDQRGEQRVERRLVMKDGVVQTDEFIGAPLMRMRGKAVKGAPYSAEAISERVQNLADGNQILTKSASVSYRDGMGRTRQENNDTKGELRTVVIHDPVAGTVVTLHPQDKTAHKMVIKEIKGEARELARKTIEEMRAEGKLPRGAGDGQHEDVVIKRVERLDGAQRDRIREDVRVRVAGAMAQEHGAREIERTIGPALAGAFGDMKWSGKASVKELGSKEIDGVKADGKMRSYEIPAGEMGNRNPIVVSDESWYAPELQVTVYSKHSDPRSGDRIYRLANLKRGEPAASLFTIPSDYTVKEGLANIKKTIIEKK